MSMRQLVEGDCGGVNPLMQLGGQFARDVAHKDEGFGRTTQFERALRPEEHMVNEFLGQVSAPPQSFHMDALLQEMREIEHANAQGQLQPQTQHFANEAATQWGKEYNGLHPPAAMAPTSAGQMMMLQPQSQQVTHVREFFDDGPSTSRMMAPPSMFPAPSPYLAICPPYQPQQGATQQMAATESFFDEAEQASRTGQQEQLATAATFEDWAREFDSNRDASEQAATDYNEKFWTRLQDEWQKLSEENEHPWLSEFDESYDPYRDYQFAEDNAMSAMDNALEKGKEYLARGDIPSAVLCFEAAAAKEPENAEIWELLGLCQAENEMDPQSIAALKRALEQQPDNKRVLMALAIGYTNESLQSHALRMLTRWLEVNPKYQHLLAQHPDLQGDANGLASSLIRGNRLKLVQSLYLDAVRQQPQEVDAEVQEALGVLYNISSDFDKAVDCFRTALHVDPRNAKVWNRLGASLANGSRSVEAVEAYQQALQLEPGFIRVRYNVGVCCMNLKAYKQAVEHFLTALNMQASTAAMRDVPAAAAAAAASGGGQQQMSEAIWSTMKMVISLMGRSDLQGQVNDRNLQALNDAFRD